MYWLFKYFNSSMNAVISSTQYVFQVSWMPLENVSYAVRLTGGWEFSRNFFHKADNGWNVQKRFLPEFS